MTEASLKQYLLDQRVDPIEAQLNQINLEMIKRLDRSHITDRTKYTIEQTIRSGHYIGVDIPRIPEQAKFKQVVIPTNTVPNAYRVGNTLYHRFTFDPIQKLPKIHPSELTFNVPNNSSVLSNGHIHNQSISNLDQLALDDIRKRQLREELEKFEKLSKKQPESTEAVGAKSNIPRQHIDYMANPIKVRDIPMPPFLPQSITNPVVGKMLSRKELKERRDALPLAPPVSPVRRLLQQVAASASTPRTPEPSHPGLMTATPTTSPYEGLGKRKTHPPLATDKLSFDLGKAKGRLSKAKVKDFIDHIKRNYDLTTEGAQELASIKSKAQAMSFVEKLQI